jgi:hypothetical protein
LGKYVIILWDETHNLGITFGDKNLGSRAFPNFLSFDIYDIDLSKVMDDSNLNFALLQTTSKSIIVVEDFDRFLTEKSTTVSLFIDVHIYFRLCDFSAFKTLANSYLGLKDHKLFFSGGGIFHSEASLSLAEISKLMIANWNSPSQAIKLSSRRCKRMVTRRVSGRSGRG